MENKQPGGPWSFEEQKLHINAKELLAALFGIKTFTKGLKNQYVKCLIDNTTAVTYINKQGGVKSTKCDDIAKSIWEWAEQNKLHFIATHIPGKENVAADLESRASNNKEWLLPDTKFQEIVSKWGYPTIDLFASRIAHKIDVYCSWLADPQAKYIDAFSFKWENNFYAFPPFSLIPRVVKKILADDATGVLVTPRWGAQPWYGLLMGIHKDRLTLPETVLTNPVTQENLHLNLVVWRI